ncbi:MAG: transcription antitermination factor NusB [Thermoleophilaceae bacterium]|nr:transcription antitermination factor NusB [Thermoleophilaceae bacterium]
MRRTEQRRRAVFALYQHDLTGRDLSGLLGSDAPAFTRELAEGALAQQERADGLISEFSQGWSLERLAPLDRNIMRVAIYEMFDCDDVPVEVSIDEAVELAKRYCAAEAPKFVNGILGTIRRERVGDKPIDDHADEGDTTLSKDNESAPE